MGLVLNVVCYYTNTIKDKKAFCLEQSTNIGSISYFLIKLKRNGFHNLQCRRLKGENGFQLLVL